MKRTRLHISRLVSLAAVMILAVIATGCSDADGPQNLEPVITLLEATDVTRTEATLSAVIATPGTGSLSYLRFRYSREGTDPQFSEDIADPSGTVTVRLTSLKPGALYTFHAEGGAGAAVISSQPLTFTTLPNDPPSLTGARTLSSGPVGVIVEFEITDDGGETLEKAGCIVADKATGTSRRIYLPDAELAEGKCRLSITPLAQLTEYTITTFASTAAGETLGTPLSFTTRDAVTLTESGVLSSIFGDGDFSLSSVAITGPMDGDDFHYLRRALGAPVLSGEEPLTSALREVDLSDADIAGGGASYDGSRFCKAGVITTGLFADCTNLKSVELPSTATAIERDAFARCPQLTEITIPASVTSVLPSASCEALRSIKVSAANDSYSSHEGVLFNSSMTEIVWFPEGKDDTFSLPSTITSIAVNAFKGTAITGLVIPASVTTIERGAFAGSVLGSIVLPDAMTNVSESMFQNCGSLRSVTLGSGVSYVGNYVFDGCPLEHLYVRAVDPPYTTADAFTSRSSDLLKNCTLHVPASSRARYRNHAKWGKFGKIVADE